MSYLMIYIVCFVPTGWANDSALGTIIFYTKITSITPNSTLTLTMLEIFYSLPS